MLLALVGAVLGATRGSGLRRRGGPSRRDGVEPPRGAADRGRPGRRQHGRLRVREPGQAGHRHDHRELHPVRGSGGRPELLPLRPERRSTSSTSTTTGTRRTTSRTSSGSRRRSANPNTFLYNTGQVTSPTDPDLNVKQTYTVTRVRAAASRTTVTSAADHARSRRRTSARARTRRTTRPTGVVDLGGGRKVFAGPRDDPFFVDLGSIFDLGGLRPFNAAHLIPLADRGRPGRRPQLQHARDRDPGAEDGPAPRADGQRDDRDLRQHEPAEDERPPRERHDRLEGRLGAGLAAREPARQRGRHSRRAEGPLERVRSAERLAVPQPVHEPRARRAS